jgi:competence protein ComEA
MKKNLFRITILVAAGCLCAPWLAAQEDTATPKKPQPKAVLDAKAKAREKKAKERAKAEAEAKAKAVDINRATKEELKKLPGITDAYADAIIAKRPYKSKAELVTKNAIPLGPYQIIRKQVAAK